MRRATLRQATAAAEREQGPGRQAQVPRPARRGDSRSPPAPLSPVWQVLATRGAERPGPLLQPKLEIGASDDPYEREADAVADRVMQMPDPAGGEEGPQALAHPICDACLSAAPPLSVLPKGPGGTAPGEAPPSVWATLASAGRSLDTSARAFFEPRFGRDLGAVRVHEGTEAATAAREINARAFARGQDIAFASGAYRPATPAGRRLLAHELAHVLQQGGDSAAPVRRKYQLGQLQTAAPRGGQVSSSPEVYFYPGSRANTVDRKAFVLAGIHREEQSAVALGRQVQGDLAAGTQRPDVHTLVMPEANTTTARGTLDLNRQFGGSPPSSNPVVREISLAVTEFQPERILSIHAVSLRGQPAGSPERLSGIYLDPVRAPGTQPASGPVEGAFTHDTRNLAGMLLTERMIDVVRSGTPGTGTGSGEWATGGNTPSNKTIGVGGRNRTLSFPASQYPTPPGGSSRYSLVYPQQAQVATSSGGRQSLGVWASGLSWGPAMLTLEIPGYLPTSGGTNWRPFLPAVWEFLRLPGSTPAPGTSAPAPSPGPPAAPPARTESHPGADVQRSPLGGEVLRRAASVPTVSRRALGLQREEAESRAPSPEAAEEAAGQLQSPLARLFAWLTRLFREIVRVLRQLDTMPPALPRERVPASLPEGCRTFASQGDLGVRKRHWGGVIAGMPVADVVQWVIGRGAPPAAAQSESRDQMDCLLHAMGVSVRSRGGAMPSGAAIRSGYRGFDEQRRIWEAKFNFTRRSPFDRVSDHARSVCGTLLRARERKWNTREPRHRACWGAAPLPGTSAPAMPAGARALSVDERQAEILQASSAPGISRHHWGTDFDLFDPNMDPEQWETGRPFADEYSWLFHNAGTYGFIQSFTPLSTFMRLGYMEERWHWSYYPVAQALVDFARGHQGDIETELLARWGTGRQFSFIRDHWREFMFNVREQGMFPP